MAQPIPGHPIPLHCRTQGRMPMHSTEHDLPIDCSSSTACGSWAIGSHRDGERRRYYSRRQRCCCSWAPRRSTTMRSILARRVLPPPRPSVPPTEHDEPQPQPSRPRPEPSDDLLPRCDCRCDIGRWHHTMPNSIELCNCRARVMLRPRSISLQTFS